MITICHILLSTWPLTLTYLPAIYQGSSRARVLCKCFTYSEAYRKIAPLPDTPRNPSNLHMTWQGNHGYNTNLLLPMNKGAKV
ncbi:hypothetical protein GGR58DRAFT_481376, partial [Xylaria digitata]